MGAQNYLEAFADYNGLNAQSPALQLSCKVRAVEPVESRIEGRPNSWSVTVDRLSEDDNNALDHYNFDAVVVCNGHYRVPRYPKIDGFDDFKGIVMHSHNYREPSAFKGMRVIVIGHANSGQDISREVANVANTVYVCANREKSWIAPPAYGGTFTISSRNIIECKMVQKLTGNTAITDCRSVLEDIDAIVICTGYKYSFPFLSESIIGVKDSRVQDVYRHIFPTSQYSPFLSFIGLPWKCIPLPVAQIQSHFVAQCLTKAIELPSVSCMIQEMEQGYEEMRGKNIPTRYSHVLGSSQFEYMNQLCIDCGLDVKRFIKDGWMETLYNKSATIRKKEPALYRDDRDAYTDIIEMVHREMKKEAKIAIPYERTLQAVYARFHHATSH